MTMTLSNKQIVALERETRSREELVKAIRSDQGKEFEKQRKALEKAVGGKKKLDDADQVLAAAKKAYDKQVSKAKADATKIIDKAHAAIAVLESDFAEQQRELLGQQAHFDRQKKAHRLKASELENAALAVKGREEAASQERIELDIRESEIRALEESVRERESKADRLDQWAKARPA